MKILNVYLPEGENLQYKLIKYPAGEYQIRFEEEHAKMILEAEEIRVHSQGDIMQTALLMDAIHHTKGMLPTPVILIFPYLPYARADRRFTSFDCAGLNTFGMHVDCMGADNVVTVDVHSSVARGAIGNFVNIKVDPLIEEIYYGTEFAGTGKKDLSLLFPDKGAATRYKTPFVAPVLYCEKQRDPKSGALSGFDVPQISTDKVLIVDDICDGGGTFIGIAQKIREEQKSVKELYLYVTHGIFSKGLPPLLSYFKRVFCTNTLQRNIVGKDEKEKGLSVFSYEPLVDFQLSVIREAKLVRHA